MTPTTRPSLLEILPLIFGPVLAVLIWLSPMEMSPTAQSAAGVISWVALWWLSPRVPLHVTGLMGVLMAHFAGLGGWSDLIKAFADPIIFLFMGGFILARAMEYQGLDQWMVKKTMSLPKLQGNTRAIYLSLIILTMLMSSMLSNTATAALVLPIAIQILRQSGSDLKETGKLTLLVAAAASIGGTMTPVGSPPNMIALGLMEKITGTRPDFLTWVLHMAPLAVMIMLGAIFIYRNQWMLLPTQGAKVQESPALSGPQRIVLVIFTATALMWALPGILPLLGAQTLGVTATKLFPESVVAIISSVVLLLIPTRSGPLLPWREAEKIDWGTLLLFGSGIALGEMCFKSGLAQVMGDQLDKISHIQPAILLSIAIVATLSFTELASNTATANLVVPILLASPTFAQSPEITIYAVVAAANMAFMLPVGTPPNAMVYSTGLFSFGTMARKGFWVNVVSAILIITFTVFIF